MYLRTLHLLSTRRILVTIPRNPFVRKFLIRSLVGESKWTDNVFITISEILNWDQSGISSLQWFCNGVCDHESGAATYVWSTFLSIKTNILSNWYLSDHVHVVNILCSRFKIKYYPSLCFPFPWNLNCNVCRLQHFSAALLIALVYNTSTVCFQPTVGHWSLSLHVYKNVTNNISENQGYTFS